MAQDGWFPSETYKVPTSCGHFYLTLVYDDDRKNLIKVLSSAGKAGGCAWTHLHSFCQRVSLLLEHVDFPERVASYVEMEGSTCHMPDCCLAKSATIVREIEMKLHNGGDKDEYE